MLRTTRLKVSSSLRRLPLGHSDVSPLDRGGEGIRKSRAQHRLIKWSGTRRKQQHQTKSGAGEKADSKEAHGELCPEQEMESNQRGYGCQTLQAAFGSVQACKASLEAGQGHQTTWQGDGPGAPPSRALPTRFSLRATSLQMPTP